MTYQDFQKSGRLGCGKCYDTFAENLSELFKKIHGSDRHVGKMLFATKETGKDQNKRLNSLKNELDDLVRTEEFEKAALLRDKINDLKKKIETEGGQS